MSDDVLKKPVHIALLKQTHIQDLADKGSIEKTPYGLDPMVRKIGLPKEQKVPLEKIDRGSTRASNMTSQARNQVRLRVIHESIPPIPPDKQPLCSSCKTAACCVAFIVELTELEYESGLYGDAAVKLTPEIAQQLNSRFLSNVKISSPYVKDKTRFVLEGMIAEPCPFLTADKRCGIYDIRPVVCRSYTCVGDQRITEGMRQGTEPIGFPKKKTE